MVRTLGTTCDVGTLVSTLVGTLVGAPTWYMVRVHGTHTWVDMLCWDACEYAYLVLGTCMIHTLT